MSRKELGQVSRIANLAFKVTGAQSQSNEVRELAGLLRAAGQAVTALTLLAAATGFSMKKSWSGVFTVKRLEHLVSDELAEELGDELLFIYQKYGDMMLIMAKGLCPVKTGRLVGSLGGKVNPDGISLTSDCPYYWVVEAKWHFVATAMDFYEPLMMVEIDALIASRQEAPIEV